MKSLFGETLLKSDTEFNSAEFNINMAVFSRRPREEDFLGLFSCTDNRTFYHIDTYVNATKVCERKNSKIYTPKICDNDFERNELERKMIYNFHSSSVVNIVWTGVKRTGYNGRE